MNNLKAERLKMGWSQERLAKETGVSRTSIARYEAETQQPTMKNARLLASGLGKSVDEVFGGDDNQDDQEEGAK